MKISAQWVKYFSGGGRLRIDDDFQGIGPPLCEEQSVTDAGIEPGCRVILEPGHAPLSNQVRHLLIPFI